MHIVLKFGCLHATYSLSVQYLSSKHDSRWVMGLDIQVHSVVYNEKPIQENVTDLKSCNLGKYLVVPTFLARRLQVRLDARASSGESWNYLQRSLSGNVKDLIPSTPFRDLILATYLSRERRTLLLMCIKCMSSNKRHKKTNDVRPSRYLCCISYRNMKCAN